MGGMINETHPFSIDWVSWTNSEQIWTNLTFLNFIESPLKRIPHRNRIPRFFEQKSSILASLISKTEKQQKQGYATKI